ncbi:MAG: peptidylprolyl isomerase [Nitrospirota bacterium]
MKRIIAIALVILFVPVSTCYGGIEIDKVAAIVNNEAITMSEIDKIASVESQEALKGLSGDKKTRSEDKLKREILRELIERRLQLQRARRLGIVVSKEELKEAIEDIKRKNALNDIAFEKALARENMTLKEYEEQLRNQLIIARLINLEVKSKVVIADRDIESYYERNKKDYLLAEYVRVSHIFLRLPEKAGEKEKTETEETLNSILKRLKNGEDFGKIARTYSHGPTAGTGGSLGSIKKGEMAPELENLAFLLKSGEISDPVRVPGGIHILKIDEKAEGRYKPLEEVMEEIKKILTEKESEDRYREWLSSLRENSFIEIRM